MSDNTSVSGVHQIVDACLSAQKLCTQAVAACLDRGEELASAKVIHALLDAATTNAAAAQMLGRVSVHSREIAHLNAEVSEFCARTIEPFERSDDILRSTYAACLRACDAGRAFGSVVPEEEESDRDKTVADSFPASDPPPPPTEI